jgi:hypothetical protein
MPAAVSLSDDSTVIFVQVSEPPTIAELSEAYEQIGHCLDQVDHPVDLLVDVTGVHTVPSGSIGLQNNPFLKHSYGRRIAIYGAFMLVRLIAEAILRITRFERAAFFKTRDEAVIHLYAKREDDDR